MIDLLPTALELTGASRPDQFASLTVPPLPGNPRVVLGLLFAVTSVLGLVISNTATAVLMAPVAVGAAVLASTVLSFTRI